MRKKEFINKNLFYMKTKILVVSMLLLTATAFGQSGTCGDNLTWTLENETLTISGTGAMTDYDYFPPWASSANFIITVVIEDGITSIGNYAFRECSNLSTINIPTSVTRIGEAAFSGCSSLGNITIPKNVSFIGREAFEGCSQLAIVNFNAENCTTPYDDDSYYSTVFPSSPYITVVNIGNEVKTIPFGIFARLERLKSIVIPNSVTRIEDSAFNGCQQLASLSLGNSVASIGSGAFAMCAIHSVIIPASVVSIGSVAFATPYLRDISVESGNEYYCSDGGVLFNKNKTTLVCYPGRKQGYYYTIPNTVTRIEDGAFTFCYNLESIKIENNITSIGTAAFGMCSGLISITIGNKVTAIGEQAFSYCYGLTSVTNLNPTPQSIASGTFYDVNLSKATLYVPAESIEAYRTANYWKDFRFIEAYVPSVITAPTIENDIRIYPNPVTESFRISGLTAPTQVVVFDVSGKTVLRQTVSGDESIAIGQLPKGVYFVRVNNKTSKIVNK
jgi:hypothetical protein